MRRAVLAFVAISSLGACGLVFDFDGYRPLSDPTALPIEAGPTVPDSDFTLKVPDTYRFDPGTSARVPITIERGAGTAPRIVVTVDPTTLPFGVTWSVDAAIEPNATSTTLVFTASPSGIANAQPVKVIATGGRTVHTREIALTVRGAPCTLDRPFSVDGTGLQPPASVISAGDDVRVTPGPEFSLVIAQSNGNLVNLDRGGQHLWTAVTDEQITAVASDASGVWFTAGNFAQRANDGQVFPDINVPIPSPCGVAISLAGNGIVCSGSPADRWHAIVFDATGKSTTAAQCLFAVDDTGLPLDATSFRNDLVGCGTVTRAGVHHAAFARWNGATGDLDPNFGVAGRLVRDEISEVQRCRADTQGIIAIGNLEGEKVMFAVKPDGTIDQAFGTNGATPIARTVEQITISNGILVLSSSGLSRFSRAGILDATFGKDGYCDFTSFGLQSSFGMTPTGDGRVLVLGMTSDVVLRLMRVWL